MNRLVINRISRAVCASRRTVSSVPTRKDVTEKNAVFDKVTHTGQAWDQADYRLQRFEIAPKQVNPNIAQKLVAEVPPMESHERVVFCDGGHPGLGHPRVYINLDKPGNHACGYCGQKFYNPHVTTEKDKDITHIEC
ncbi:putative NADH dehydrogenase [ubiquinone] iron-sulfur protein 6, mitochondrial [Toxocara canis]|uniref:NADH dehydrogenase [ubiquinone] iron-sulfur protein 6, mitochondrial n=2 Tax=Toxocara canis TaxID=6265 RepID=A0A0B2VFK4_TOXCA|nr:putative NADH dehydrogenase [ubiquinone] iron-sulfur protein 6, mitochondrial [Toxocara canis]VDM46120.1 unnamed protein product [Toxocara canis]